MDIRNEVVAILENSGYRVREVLEGSPLIYFEDSSLVGFVSIEPTCDQLLRNWKSRQDFFLQSNAQKFRAASFKAWNAYSVFLTEGICSDEENRGLQQIEEDFRGTRKVASANLLTRDDLRRALYPLLPIQNLIALQGRNAVDLLLSRLTLSEDQKRMFLSDESPEELVNLLMEEE